MFDFIKNIVFSYIGVLAVAFVLFWLTPLWETVDQKYEGVSFGKYATAFGIGFAVLVALPLASIVLMMTGFGLRIGLLLMMLYIAAIAVSPVFIGYFAGRWIWRKVFKKAICYPAEIALGILAWRIVASVPIVSFVLGFVSLPFGVGVLVLLLGKKKTTASPVLPTTWPEQSSEPTSNE